MAGIFISYRRDDSQGFAGRLYDDLLEIFGDELVFRDVEIPLGSDFTQVLQRAIAASDLLLVVIGPAWARPGPEGCGDRLFEAGDWVRAEIEMAFQQDKPVIPVLVGDAEMPAPERLPPSLQRLSRLQAAALNDRHWEIELQALADRLRALCPALGDAGRKDSLGEPLAAVVRELGERLLERAERPRSRRPRRTWPERLWRPVRKALGTATVLAVLYVGLRLFGDTETLRQLDRFEDRLGVGWERLQGYLEAWLASRG